MITRKILIFANSIKHSGHCVAGREVVTHDRRYRLGGWIRPVSRHGTGELSWGEITDAKLSPVAVMEFAEVSLEEKANDPCQPENWFIAKEKSWRKISEKFAPPTPRLMEESPANLWLDRAEFRKDRYAHEKLIKAPPAASLYVIRPRNLRLVFSMEHNEHKREATPRKRAIFFYNGIEYDFSLTDPAAIDKYGRPMPLVGEKAKVVEMPSVLACVSLASDFNGYHYKVLATVMEIGSSS